MYFSFLLCKIKVILFPPVCTFCSARTEEYYSLCSKCWFSIKFINRNVCRCCGEGIVGQNIQKYPGNICINYCGECKKLGFTDFDENVVSSVIYDDFVKQYIIKFKQNNSPSLALLFSRFLHFEDFVGFDLIIPVPIHPFRLFKRTYSQTALIANAVKYWHENTPPVSLNILRKSRYTPKQKGKHSNERMDNVKDSFFIPKNKKNKVYMKKIILIDDVLASGATLLECKRVLEECGAKKVKCITIAKTDFNKRNKLAANFEQESGS